MWATGQVTASPVMNTVRRSGLQIGLYGLEWPPNCCSFGVRLGDVSTALQNTHGQLGDGTTTDRHTPVRLDRLGVDNRAVSASSVGHTLYLKADGKIWAAGLNSFGQLGVGDIIDRHTPIRWHPLSFAPCSCTD